MSPALPKPSPFSQKTQLAALVGSVGYVLVLLLPAGVAYGLSDVAWALVSIQVGPWLWWAILRGAVLGAVLAVTVVRYGLVSPLLSVAVVYVATMYRMWQALQSPNPLLPGTPLDLYLLSWPLLLGLALTIGLAERRVRAAKPTAGDSEQL